MPRQWTLTLAADPQRPIGWRFDVLHAIACSAFEQPGSGHDANEKAFSVRTGPRGSQRIILTWLDDRAVPDVQLGETILVGDEKIPVADVHEIAVGYDEIEATSATRELGFAVSTPALFRHNGHNYPLPDPYVTFASLARRYQTYRPEAPLDDHQIRELGRAVTVVRHRIKTEQFSWHGRTDSGFTGEVGFQLAPGTRPDIRRAFTTLGTFARIASIGRGTTHGLGTINASRAGSENIVRRHPAG